MFQKTTTSRGSNRPMILAVQPSWQSYDTLPESTLGFPFWRHTSFSLAKPHEVLFHLTFLGRGLHEASLYSKSEHQTEMKPSKFYFVEFVIYRTFGLNPMLSHPWINGACYGSFSRVSPHNGSCKVSTHLGSSFRRVDSGLSSLRW